MTEQVIIENISGVPKAALARCRIRPIVICHEACQTRCPGIHPLRGE
jgi:hypothetical protein